MEGVQNIGFNMEEIEGVNTSSSLLHPGMEARYRSFFARVIARAGQANAPLVVREQQELLAMLQHPTFGRFSKNTNNDPFGFMTVSSRGAIFTFSPELAGLTDPTYGDLAVGQLPDDSLEDVFSRQSFQRMWADIEQVPRCARLLARISIYVWAAHLQTNWLKTVVLQPQKRPTAAFATKL